MLHVCEKSESHSGVSDSLGPYGLYSPWNSLGQNTGVGSLSLLQGIVPIQGWNPDLPHCRRSLCLQNILYLSQQGSPLHVCIYICDIYTHTPDCMYAFLVTALVSDFFVTLWTVAHQAPLSVGFSRQEYWRELPCPPPGDLPDPGIEPRSPKLTHGFSTTGAAWEAHCMYICVCVYT